MVQGKEKTENGCVLNIWCIKTIFTGVARGSAFVHSGDFFTIIILHFESGWCRMLTLAYFSSAMFFLFE